MPERAKTQLPPQRWKVILIVTDTPGPGETHLMEPEIRESLNGLPDIVAGNGIGVEIGSFEKIAK